MERKNKPLSQQVKTRTTTPIAESFEYSGNDSIMISTGSTLLDLAISGGRVRGGGIPAGILVEIFGPSGCGKTVLLCEIAGDMQRKKGDIMFNDPEARLNHQFAEIFDLNIKEVAYDTPDTVTELFLGIRGWEPKTPIAGVFAVSLAALSTEMEMDSKDGDKMGMRRAKEFSEELRKTCRILPEKNILMVCSNQIRQNMDAGPYGQKYISPGGESVGFYSSLRLRAVKPDKIKAKKYMAGKEVTRVIGVTTTFEVHKSSIWKPFRSAPVTILFDYGIDDIRQNLQFIKDYTKNTTYTLNGEKLDVSLEKSITLIEEDPISIKQLKEEVIDLWEILESKFKSDRKPKIR